MGADLGAQAKALSGHFGSLGAHSPMTEGFLDGKIHLERENTLSGNGSLRLQNALIGKWSLPRSGCALS